MHDGMRPDQPLNERAALDRLRAMALPVDFDAGFADRVMVRLAHAASTSRAVQPPFSQQLSHVFSRIAPLAAAAILILATMNVVRSRASEQPLLDRVLGLPTVTLAAAYSLGEGVDFDGEVWR